MYTPLLCTWSLSTPTFALLQIKINIHTLLDSLHMCISLPQLGTVERKKFGGENIWQIYSFQVFGGEKVWRMDRSAKE